MKRLIASFFHSLAGLRHGFVHETEIRHELIFLLLSIPVVPVITLDPWRMLALWASLLLLILTELLNTGIEQVANRVPRDFAPEIRFAKDCGSAAVLAATIIAAGVWGIILYEWLVLGTIAQGWVNLFLLPLMA